MNTADVVTNEEAVGRMGGLIGEALTTTNASAALYLVGVLVGLFALGYTVRAIHRTETGKNDSDSSDPG